MANWGDGVPEFDDHPAGAWGDGLPLGPIPSVPPVPPVEVNFIAEILIGNTVVWSAVNSFPKESITIDVSNINGKHDLKFRIRGTS